MEEYQITFSPELGISPADFVAAWNEEATSKGYFEPVTTTIVIGIVTGMAANAIYDLIKKVMVKQRAGTTHLHFEELQKPDGTRFVIIDKDDKKK